MTLAHLRVLFYFLSPLIGMLPGVSYAAEAKQIIIDLEAALIGIGATGLLSGGIFQVWGKK